MRFRSQFLAFVLVLFTSLAASAQSSPVPFYVSFVSESAAVDTLGKQVIERFREAMVARGAIASAQPDWHFYLNVSATSHGLVALTLVQGATLPEAAVQAGANEEMFYAGWDEAKLPPEGREVRVFMSESFLRQFVSIQHLETVVVEEAMLMQAVDALAKSFHARYPRR